MTKTISEKENLKNLKSSGKFTIICLIILIAGLWLGKIVNESDDAMQKCQETQSYDTCFWILNK